MKTNDWRKEVLSGANVAQFQIYCSESVSCSLLLAAKGDNLVFLSSSDPGGRIFDGLKTIKRVFLLFNNNFIFIHKVSPGVYVCLCVREGVQFQHWLKKIYTYKNIKKSTGLSSEYLLRRFVKLTNSVSVKSLSHE